jgi:hypothetical protein
MSACLEIERKLNSTARPLISLLGSVLVTLVLGSYGSASAQMGSSATYSDSWVDDSEPESVAIVGTGVTQDTYNSYGHTYWVVTTLTSPSGRTSNATSYHTNAYNAYTSTETSLTWDWNDLGDYTTGSQHWMCCPYMANYCFANSSTTVVAKAGASRAAYNLTSQNFCCCTYHIIPNCYVRCGPTEVATVQVSACSAHIVRIQPWYEVRGTTVCVAGLVLIQDTDVATPCGED